MVKVYESAVLDYPIDQVWSVIRDFNGHFQWHPIVRTSAMEHGQAADSIGAIRRFLLQSGETVKERLLTLSDRNYAFSYCITESELPLSDYVAHVELKPITESNRTLWRWWSEFNTPKGQEEEIQALVANGVYRAGFDGVRNYLSTFASIATAPIAVAEDDSKLELQPEMHTEGVIALRHGDANVLQVTTLRAPFPNAGEVRVKHEAIGVNFIDIYTRTGYFNLIEPPAVLGMEAAGVVIDTGANVKHLKQGDRVCYACLPTGAYANIRTMPAELVFQIPDEISFDTAAALTLKGVTAYFLLHKVHQLKPQETVLIFAPAGGVGNLLVQWAVHYGARVIGATSSEEKAAKARLSGAHDVVLPGKMSLEQQIHELTNGAGVDVVFDAVGKDSFTHSIAALKNCGHLISFGQASGDIGQQDIGAMAGNSLTLSRPNFSHYTDTREKMSEALDAVWAASRERYLHCEIGQRYPLCEAKLAHHSLETRQSVGSTILIPTHP